MLRKINNHNFFASIFSLGLFLMIVDVVKDFFYMTSHTGNFSSNLISFSAVGFIVCLISMPFLLIEWLVSPLGTQAKRIKFYQGAGNLCALVMLTAGWLWRNDSAKQIMDLGSLTFSSGGMLAAVIFGWTGSRIASFISKKRIEIGTFSNAAQKNMIAPLVEKKSNLETKITSGNLVKGISSTPVTQS